MTYTATAAEFNDTEALEYRPTKRDRQQLERIYKPRKEAEANEL